MLKLIFRQDNPEDFERYWQSYLEANQSSPYYLLTMLNYFLAYSGEKLWADKSFVCLKGDRAAACVFLPIEEAGGVRSISIGGSFTLAPLFLPQKNLESEVMREIDKIAKDCGVKKIMFRLDALLHESYPYNYLLNHDYLGAPLLGYLVDCEQISLRRNHQRAIRKIEKDKNFEIQIMDQKNADYEIHERYRELHHKAAKRVTRSKASFDLQFQMLKEGHAVLVGLKYKQSFVAFTYFVFYGQGAISFSAADDPEFVSWPLYHIINAEALKYLRSRGVKEMDVGQPLTLSHQWFYSVQEKQKNIALFKTGFGGRFVENFRGVKYFSKQAFQQDVANFTKVYEQSIIQ